MVIITIVVTPLKLAVYIKMIVIICIVVIVLDWLLQGEVIVNIGSMKSVKAVVRKRKMIFVLLSLSW